MFKIIIIALFVDYHSDVCVREKGCLSYKLRKSARVHPAQAASSSTAPGQHLKRRGSKWRAAEKGENGAVQCRCVGSEGRAAAAGGAAVVQAYGLKRH